MEDENSVKDIPPNQHFWARNGTIIKNLHGLKTAIEHMDQETFDHHVNSGKNDFSEWLRNVIKDEELADKVSRTGSKEEMAKVLEENTKKKRPKAEKKAPAPGKTETMVEEKQAEEESSESEIEVIPCGEIEEILLREKEIDRKEEKIREIEDKIEKRLEEIKNAKTTTRFFSKEFVQGLITGLLLVVLGILIYLKFFAVV